MNASEVISDLKRRFPGEPEYLQAVEEVLGSIEDVYNEHPEFEKPCREALHPRPRVYVPCFVG